MSKPLISVVIDTYNCGRFVEEAVESVLAQDYPAGQIEVLVVDDGSTDDTAERLKKYGDRIQYFYKPNGGQASAFNCGIARAKGDLVAFLDGDDVWLPRKLSRVVETFERNPNVVMVYHKFQFWDPSDNWTWEPGTPDVSGDILADRQKVLDYVAAPTSSLVFRRAALERVLPIPSSMKFMADAYLVGTAIFLGRVGYLPDCLTKNRVHGGNLWFAERHAPSRELLRRRVETRREVMRGLRQWIEANAPARSRRQARLYLTLWDLLQDTEEFQLEPPGRWREFVHLVRHALAVRPVVSLGNFAYRWAHAFAVLIMGRRAHYLEGVRSRIKAWSRGSRKKSAETKPQQETVGHA